MSFFTPIPAQRKEALGPVLYLGRIPTYSLPTLLAVSKRFDKRKKMLFTRIGASEF